MSVTKEEALSPDELRKRLYQTFKTRGVLDTLKVSKDTSAIFVSPAIELTVYIVALLTLKHSPCSCVSLCETLNSRHSFETS